MRYEYPYGNAGEADKLRIWNKGEVIEGYDEKVWRRDICSNAIKYSEHGNTDSEFGWEIDHILPSSLGGTDELSNLQPLHWENNRKKGDAFPWTC